MKITVLTDSSDSWFIPYGRELVNAIRERGHDAMYVHHKKQIREGDVCFMLSCNRIVQLSYLARNENNIVVHTSDLPQGKGFAPMKRQILEGRNVIPLTLFEAVEAVDAGQWYIKDSIEFEGHELLDELQDVMAKKIIEMCLRYLDERDDLPGVPQEGDETFYGRFTKEEDEIDPERSIAQQWNSFRVSDNERFPRWFSHMGHRYVLKIEKLDDNGEGA